jgi:hypothetical protein
MKERQRSVPSKWLTFTLAFALWFAGAGSVAWADSAADNFTWIINPPGADVSAAANGETIQMSGAGMLSFHSKSVAGGGTFTQSDSAGNVIATGTWTAVELLSFDDYGQTPGFPIPTAHGGDALMRVHLTPSTGGPGVDAILDIFCILGNPPPGHNTEGIRLAVQGGGPNFNKIVAGSTIFLAI